MRNVIPKPREATARFLQRGRRGEESAPLLSKFATKLAQSVASAFQFWAMEPVLEASTELKEQFWQLRRFWQFFLAFAGASMLRESFALRLPGGLLRRALKTTNKGQADMNGQQQTARKPHIYHESTQEYVATPYKHQNFPKWKYHAAKPPALVNNVDEEKALGQGWTDQRITQEPVSPEETLRCENEDLKKQLAELQKTKAETEKTIKEKQSGRTS